MKIFKSFSIALTILFFGLTLAPALAGAAGFSGDNSNPQFSGDNSQPKFSADNALFGLKNPLAAGSFCQLIKALLNIIILLGIPIATFFVLYAGFKLVLARGRPAELEKARLNLFYTVVGIAIFLGAWLLAQVISNTIAALGIQILGSCTN